MDMAGGKKRTQVWWDINSCPVPDGVEPGRVRGCIEAALEKEMGGRSKVTMFAIGNLEFISSALLKEIYSSGIFLIHAPCGGKSLGRLLGQWHEHPTTVMLISCDCSMVNNAFLSTINHISSAFYAYPKDYRAPVFKYDVFAKEFVWETLLNDNMTTASSCGGEMMIVNQEAPPLCICDLCQDTFQICAEFITHLKSEEHIEELFEIVPRDPDSGYAEAKYFCQVCKYPAYDDYNLFFHNESEEHNLRKNAAENMAQDPECRKRNPQVDLLNEANNKQSFEGCLRKNKKKKES